MYSLGLDVYITRGETWTYDALIVNKDGSPYVISNQYPNPYYLFKMSSVEYQVNERYYDEIWCPIPVAQTFYSSVPCKITSFPDNFSVSDLSEEIQQEIADKGLTAANYAVYYVTDDDGINTYKQWTGTEWKDYECAFPLVFMSKETSLWKAQTYTYKLDIVSGEKLADELSIDNITHSNHIATGQIIVAGNLDAKGGAQ